MAKVEKEKKEKKHFFKDFKAELKKVIWPTTKQVANNTTAVIAIVLLTTLIVFVLDLGFETLNTHGVDKLKSVVGNADNSNVLFLNNATSENLVNANVVLENAISE